MFTCGLFRKYAAGLFGSCILVVTVGTFLSIFSVETNISLNPAPFLQLLPPLVLKPIGQEACNQTRKIIFLKTHETGSSTLQNILYRFGEERKLSFALPAPAKERSYQFPYRPGDWPTAAVPWPAGGRFRTDMVDNWEDNKHFDLLVQHIIWNRAEAEKAVPGGYKITILREPVARFVSAYSYFEYYKMKPLDTFAREVEAGGKLDWEPKLHCPLYDIGLNDTHDMIPTFKQDFDQVLIREYFEESLVLLADALCWDLMDVRFGKMNKEEKGKKKKERHEDATPRKSSWPGLRIWTAAEQELYQHFLKGTVHEKKSDFDSRFRIVWCYLI